MKSYIHKHVFITNMYFTEFGALETQWVNILLNNIYMKSSKINCTTLKINNVLKIIHYDDWKTKDFQHDLM